MMALSDSMFVFEINVEEFISYMSCKEFSIKSQFADVFTFNLKNPNELNGNRKRKIKSNHRLKVKNKATRSSSSKIKIQTGQSVLLVNSIDWLITHMNKHPLELSLWSKKYPKKKLGETFIPWKGSYIDYLNKLKRTQKLTPITVNGTYSILNKSTNKCIASISLRIKFCHLKGTSTEKENKFKDTTRGFITTTNSNKMINMKEIGDKSFNPYHNFKNISHEGKYNFIHMVKSDTEIGKHSPITNLRSKSLSLLHRKQLNPLTYVFGCPKGSFGNRVYCVSYFTVEKDANVVDKSKICNIECPMKHEVTGSCSKNPCFLDLSEDASHPINITKCKQVDCINKKDTEALSSSDHRILLDLTNLKAECCNFTEKIEEVVGGVSGKIKIGDDPCFCTCECRFGFTKKTTYCNVCGGYEIVGEELVPNMENQKPFPCPIFHKLVDKSKLKNWSTSGSESKKKGDDQSTKSMKVSSGQKASATSKRQVPPKNVESEKDTKKGKIRNKDDRFKFNYGYKGIPPQIGHSECAMPCTGTLGVVPKNMGWLWTAEDIPGMKFRPMWKPGAVNKHVLRLLRFAKNPGEIISKKRRKEPSKKKSLKRPLLIVHKKDGEYTVTMETMKTYSKPRAPNQHPYEEKPLITYTIGRTDEENRDRRKKREREQRRLERAQRKFIQSAFKDVCQDICLKTYQQALGILPGAEDPECPCFTAQSDKMNVDVSCSCSEKSTSIGSDTDLDEWIVEFTPPNAIFDPTYKGKKVLKTDIGTQYTYLDYKVKLVDRFGNPVPRFFKGPDGKQQCSDLGGFWSPDHKWLEFNIDGYVAPDGRWAPNIFIGPNGEHVDAETGKFQVANGKWLVVGVDGYVDCTGKWRYYSRPKVTTQTKRAVVNMKKGAGDKADRKRAYKPSEASWSCFGDVSPNYLSTMGIVGHGQDKKVLLAALRDMLARGENVRIPKPSSVYRLPESKKSKQTRMARPLVKSYLEDRYKCRHPVPSTKGILASDGHGNKTYFRLKGVKNRRPKERLANLVSQGISLSSFHVPCFHSFINSEIMKRQQRERLRALAEKSVATQADY